MPRDVKTVKGGYVMNFIKKQAAGFYLMLLALNSFRGRTGKVAGNAGTGYSSDSGGSAFDGRICIFCPPESEQHCDYFII